MSLRARRPEGYETSDYDRTIALLRVVLAAALLVLVLIL